MEHTSDYQNADVTEFARSKTRKNLSVTRYSTNFNNDNHNLKVTQNA